MSSRVYIPSTLELLRQVMVSGGIGPAPFLAHAVTDELRAAYDDGGEEEWEYAAMSAAAQDALALLGPDSPPRRVVVVAEAGTVRALAGDREPAGDVEVTLVEVQDVVPVRNIAAVHVDAADAAEDVAAAAAVWEQAASGDADTSRVVDRCLGHELGWYATQEIGELLGDDPPR